MKNLLILATMLLTFGSAKAQSLFNEEINVISYMDGKSFYNSDNGLTIEYGYISSYNTYGIKVKNKDGGKFYFINVEITTHGTFADLFGIVPQVSNRIVSSKFPGRVFVFRYQTDYLF